MPRIRAVVWNIQNLGIQTDYRSAWSQLAQFVADVVQLADADVLLIEELRAAGIGSYILQHIQSALNNLAAPMNNWCYDWIKGSIAAIGAPPFATAADLDWDVAHYEGYAVFWNQNIAKFRMTPAPPIQPPGALGPTPNSQSETTRIQGVSPAGAAPGLAVPDGGIVTPAVGMPYILPTGTTPPGGAPLAAPTPVAAGTVLQAGTLIGPAGVTLNTAPLYGVEQRVIPGGYTLTDDLTLPPAGTILVPEHTISLVLFGRAIAAPWATSLGDIAGVTADFNPAGGTPWDWLNFTRGAGYNAVLKGARRPAYVVLDVNRAPPNDGPDGRLTPMIVYHAPSAAPASTGGMQRASFSQPLYQAYDPAAGAWINCDNALLGGDFNVLTDSVAYAYDAYLQGFAAGGANCTALVYNPPPPRANNTINQSIVRITTRLGAQIYGANPDDFRALAIDNVFFRGFAGVTGELCELPTAVSGGAAPIPIPTVQGFLQVPRLREIANALIGAGPPPATTAPLVAPPSTVFDLQAGVFGAAGTALPNDTPARRTAEFVSLCVSDHLPVLFEGNL